MSDFRYVTKAEYANAKADLIDLIGWVQDEVRDNFTFQYKFVGSVERNMVTRDYASNVGYDFDVNIEVNDDDNNYSAKEIKNILCVALDKYAKRKGYDYAEDSTRVLTIKVKDRKNSRILHSVDFAIVNNYGNGRQQYIHYNKSKQTYSWQEQPKGYYQLPEKVEWLKANGLWGEVRDLYLYKKNNNYGEKKSRSLFAESVNEMYQQN